jgi:transposase
MKRKRFSTEFKAKVAIEAIKGGMTVNELSSEFGVHPSQINGWKKLLLTNAGELFGGTTEKSIESFDQERSGLYEQIGKLQVQLDWVKKKTGHLE